MKLFATTLTAIMALKGSHGWKAIRSRGDSGRQLSSYFQLWADVPDVTACLIVKDSKARKGQKLILGDCNLSDQAWRLDGDGLYHTKLDSEYCMQAGRGGKKIKPGTRIRLFKCDKDKNRQQFRGPGDGIGTILLKDTDYDYLLVEFRGETPNVNVDPIIMKKRGASVAGWSQDA
jgi:hypothetical protein